MNFAYVNWDIAEYGLVDNTKEPCYELYEMLVKIIYE